MFFKKYRKHLIKKTRTRLLTRVLRFLFFKKMSIIANKKTPSPITPTLQKKNYLIFFWKQFFLGFPLLKKKIKRGLSPNPYPNTRETPRNKILLFSKAKTPFAGCLGNFCFIQAPLTLILNDTYSFFYKKTMYSFLEKNELQKYILKKYLKNTSLKRENGLGGVGGLGNNAGNQQFNLKFTTLSQSLLNTKNSFFFKELLFTKTFEEQELNLNIRKIKFKPGYMNI